MNEENLPPFEIFERIADERIGEYLEPMLKTFRSELRRVKKNQEINEAELVALRENFRQELNMEVGALRRGYQTAIDSLTSRVAQLTVELKGTRFFCAVSIIKEACSSAIEAYSLSADAKERITRKYEAAIIESQYVDDPMVLAAQFNKFCVDEGKKEGIPMIEPGLKRLA